MHVARIALAPLAFHQHLNTTQRVSHRLTAFAVDIRTPGGPESLDRACGAQAGRVGNGAEVPLGVAKEELTYGELIHLGPQSKVYRVRSRRMLDELL